jgi:hypothetical protein
MKLSRRSLLKTTVVAPLAVALGKESHVAWARDGWEFMKREALFKHLMEMELMWWRSNGLLDVSAEDWKDVKAWATTKSGAFVGRRFR